MARTTSLLIAPSRRISNPSLSILLSCHQILLGSPTRSLSKAIVGAASQENGQSCSADSAPSLGVKASLRSSSLAWTCLPQGRPGALRARARAARSFGSKTLAPGQVRTRAQFPAASATSRCMCRSNTRKTCSNLSNNSSTAS